MFPLNLRKEQSYLHFNFRLVTPRNKYSKTYQTSGQQPPVLYLVSRKCVQWSPSHGEALALRLESHRTMPSNPHHWRTYRKVPPGLFGPFPATPKWPTAACARSSEPKPGTVISIPRGSIVHCSETGKTPPSIPHQRRTHGKVPMGLFGPCPMTLKWPASACSPPR